MTEREPEKAIQKMGEAFGESYRRAAENVAEAQQRNVRLAQGWVEGVGGVLERRKASAGYWRARPKRTGP